MSYATIRKLLEVRLNTVGGVFATAFENAPFTPARDPWQRVNLLPARTSNPTYGDSHKRELGLLQVMLHYPLNAGSAAALARAEVIRSGFPRGLVLSEGAVRIMINESPSISAGVNDGTWYQVPVSIPYIADVN